MSRNRGLFANIAMWVAALTPHAVTQTAHAQASSSTSAPAASSEDPSSLEQIVVTAERRSENLQRVPLTIQVLSGNQLRDAGVLSPEDLGRQVPGVNLTSGSNFTQIYVRGVGGFSYSPLTNPGVAFNVDNVYIGQSNAIAGNFYDVNRVEVVKGPQGTLSGRNANGGSINVITNLPQVGVFGGDLNVDVGNYALKHVDGAINIPLGDASAIRAAFNVVDRHGYLSDGTDDDVQQNGRVRFLTQPTDAITFQLVAGATHLGGEGGGTVWLPRRPGADPWEAVTSPASNAYLASFNQCGCFLGPLITPFSPNSRQSTMLWNVGAQLDWNLNFATLTVIPAFRHANVDSLSYPQFTFRTQDNSSQKTLEVRLGKDVAALTWVAGFYYYNESIDGTNSILISDPLDANQYINYHPRTEAYAGFGQATVTVVEGLRVIAGVRDTQEHRRLTGGVFNNDPFYAPHAPDNLLEPLNGDKTFNGVNWRGGVEYDIAAESLAYATYSTGYKAGGFNQTVAPQNTYDPEKLNAIEVGIRNRFLEGRVRANVSLFDWRYKQIQDQRVAFDPLGNVSFLTVNDGSAHLQGFNWDVAASITRADTLSLNGEYAHSHYTSFLYNTPAPFFSQAETGCPSSGPFPGSAPTFVPVIRVNCAGLQVARVPTWSGTVAYAHTFALATGAAVKAGADVAFASSQYVATDFIAAEHEKGHGIVDANLDYTSPSRAWSIGAYARNIGDVAYYTNGTQQAFVSGLFAANIAPPRTFGFRAHFEFN